MTTPAPVFVAARRPRTPLTIDLDRGLVAAGGQRMTFDPAGEDAPYLAYLRLVRRLRDVHREPSFVLRRDDVEALAAAMRQDAVLVLERLGELMGATVTQRRTMVTAFAAGAVLIAVATGAAALVPGAVRQADDAPEPAAGGDAAPGGDDAPGGDTAGAPADTAPPAPPAPDADPAGEEVDEVTPDAAAPAPQGSTPSTRVGPPAPAPAPGPTPTPPVAPEPPAGDRAPTDGAPVQGDPDPAPPAAPPAPETEVTAEDGEADGWQWGGPEVVQPGADIDIPDDDEAAPGDGDAPADPSPDALAS